MRSSLLPLVLPLVAFAPSSPARVELLDGAVDVTSFGTAEVMPDDGSTMLTFHVRTSYANRGVLPWTIDAAATRLVLGNTTIAPLAVNADVATLPLVRVSSRERRVVDLYFQIPNEPANDSPITVVQQVMTPDHRYDGRTQLVRDALATPSEPQPPVGAGRSWWANPQHAWPTFYPRDGRLVARPPQQLVITRYPDQQYVVMPEDHEPWPRTDECNEW